MEVFLTKRANAKLIAIRDRINREFGKNASMAFEQRVYDFFKVVESFPQIGAEEFPEKKIYGFQLSEQTRIFYRIKGERVIILNFFDVRRDPKRKLD